MQSNNSIISIETFFLTHKITLKSIFKELTDVSIDDLIKKTEKACWHAPNWSKAWRNWAIFHLRAVTYYNDQQNKSLASMHVAPAVRGFFKSLKLSQSPNSDDIDSINPGKDAYQV